MQVPNLVVTDEYTESETTDAEDRYKAFVAHLFMMGARSFPLIRPIETTPGPLLR